MLVFGERGNPEYPGKNLSERSREPTNSSHIWLLIRESNPGHIGGRPVLSPLRQHCLPPPLFFANFPELFWFPFTHLSMKRRKQLKNGALQTFSTQCCTCRCRVQLFGHLSSNLHWNLRRVVISFVLRFEENFSLYHSHTPPPFNILHRSIEKERRKTALFH